jgi:hypothetical protein
MASPAPLTTQPTLPSSLMNVRFALRASTSLGLRAVVAQLLEVGAALDLVVVDHHLRVDGDDLALRRDDERVDLGERAPVLDERLVELLHDLARRARLLRVLVQEEAELLRLEGEKTVARVDAEVLDLLGRRRGDFLDVDAAGGADHEDGLLGRAVDDDPDVRLGADVGGLGDEHLLDGQALDVHAEDRLRLLARRLGRRAVLHAAGLAAAADVDLRLHHDGLPDAAGDGLGLVRRRRHLAGRDRHAVAAKHILRLVLVNVH